MTALPFCIISVCMDGSRPPPDTLYERDFAAWSAEQGRLMRTGAYDRVDWENVIEEIEALGRGERSALRSAIALVLEHKLKFDHGLNDRPKGGWRCTIRVQQRHARKTLKENPSLRPVLAEMIAEEYADSRESALDSFELHEEARPSHYRAAIPAKCPYTEADVLG